MLIVQFSEHFPFPIDKASIMHIKAHLLFISVLVTLNTIFIWVLKCTPINIFVHASFYLCHLFPNLFFGNYYNFVLIVL